MKEIIDRLAQSGKIAWIAGGAVRDLLLGSIPKDFDIVSDASPEEVEALFPKTLAIGKQFGIMVVITDYGNVEVARFRSEGSYADGRRPEHVSFDADPTLDAARRDFTVNALFYDPKAGLVFDYVGGMEDFQKRLIRCVGDPEKRFQEDGLRVLRAVRLLAQLAGFRLEEETRAAVFACASRLGKVSRERITQEIQKILSASSPRPALELIGESPLWRMIFIETFQVRTIDVFLTARGLLEPLNASISLLALFLASLPDWVDNGNLILTNAERNALSGIARAKNLIERIPNGSLADMKIALADPYFEPAWALRSAEFPDLKWQQSLPQEKLALSAAGRLAPAPFLGGDDLKKIGVQQGPEIKKILDAVRRAQLDEIIVTEVDAEAMARRLKSPS